MESSRTGELLHANQVFSSLSFCSCPLPFFFFYCFFFILSSSFSSYATFLKIFLKNLVLLHLFFFCCFFCILSSSFFSSSTGFNFFLFLLSCPAPPFLLIPHSFFYLVLLLRLLLLLLKTQAILLSLVFVLFCFLYFVNFII